MIHIKKNTIILACRTYLYLCADTYLDVIQHQINSKYGYMPVTGMKKKSQPSELLFSSFCSFLCLLAQSSL